MVKPLIAILLALTTSNAIADNVFIYEDEDKKPSKIGKGNMYIYKEEGGQVLLTNVNPSSNFDKFTKKVKVTYHRDSKVDGDSKSNSNSSSYANSAYLSLR